jgi:signal transduction histidine kinase
MKGAGRRPRPHVATIFALLLAWLTVRDAKDEDTRRGCGVIMAVSFLLGAFLLLGLATTRLHDATMLTWTVAWLGLPTTLGSFALARSGRDRLAATLLTAYAFSGVLFVCVSDGPDGQRFGLMTVAVLLAGSLIRGWVTALMAAGFAVLAVAIDTLPAVQALALPNSFTRAQHLPYLRQSALCGLLVYFLRRGYDYLYAEVSRHDRERAAALHETRKLNESLERLAGERTKHLEATRDRVASIANDVAVDLQGDIGRIGDKLVELRAATAVTDPDRLADLGKASLAAERLGAMVQNLVDHARLGRVALSPANLDMNALAHAVVEQARASPEGARVAFSLQPLPATRADPVLLRSVLENLVSNAVKFSARRRWPTVTIGFSQGRYFVSDNGAGFDPRYVERLFAPFSRLHSRGEYEGQGIGLANVRSIIERHGGEVEAAGEVDGGARFSFRLPEERPA